MEYGEEDYGGAHFNFHLSSYYKGNYRGVADGHYWKDRLNVASTTYAYPNGHYIYPAVNQADYQLMRARPLPRWATRKLACRPSAISPGGRERHSPMNAHCAARGAMAHYLGLVNSEHETDLHPALLCLEFDCTQEPAQDTRRQWPEQHDGTFNHHYMGYSLFRFTDMATSPSSKEDYGHYVVNSGTTQDYINAQTEPVHSGYTSRRIRRTSGTNTIPSQRSWPAAIGLGPSTNGVPTTPRTSYHYGVTSARACCSATAAAARHYRRSRRRSASTSGSTSGWTPNR